MPAHPPWQAHLASGFDGLMDKACIDFLRRIKADRPYRLSVLQDPRDLHRQIFLRSTPPGYPEYAGTYRGTPGTSLEARRMGAQSLASPGDEFAFEEPAGLPDKVTFLLEQVMGQLESARQAQPYELLLLLTHQFCWFGKLHPFLDGNGHIQRALFASLATELDIPISTRFALHPRSFDSLLAWPLELFTRAEECDRPIYLAMVAEYLGFWLAGPFDVAGSGIPPA